MSTDALWEAAALWTKVFSRLYEIPLGFDGKSRRIFVITETRRLTWWFVFVVVIWVLSLGPQLLKLLSIVLWTEVLDNVIILQLICIFMYFVTSGGAPLLCILLYLLSDGLIFGLNSLLDFEQIMKKRKYGICLCPYSI